MARRLNGEVATASARSSSSLRHQNSILISAVSLQGISERCGTTLPGPGQNRESVAHPRFLSVSIKVGTPSATGPERLMVGALNTALAPGRTWTTGFISLSCTMKQKSLLGDGCAPLKLAQQPARQPNTDAKTD
jgi:hypothetical protein